MRSEANNPLTAVDRSVNLDPHVPPEQPPDRRFGQEQPGLGRTMKPIWDLWWLILAVWVLCVSAAVVTTLNTPTTYTARSSMIVSSNNRSPDQDAVLVQGYVDYFNDPAYQSALVAQTSVDGPVTMTARAAASSPIMLIEATSTSAADAQDAAALIALQFQKDVNEVRDREKSEEIASWQRRLDQLTEAGGPGSEGAAGALQERIVQLRSDRVNELQELQLGGGVSANAPSLATNALFGGVGGLLLGILAALAYDKVTRQGRGLPRLSRHSGE